MATPLLPHPNRRPHTVPSRDPLAQQMMEADVPTKKHAHMLPAAPGAAQIAQPQAQPSTPMTPFVQSTYRSRALRHEKAAAASRLAADRNLDERGGQPATAASGGVSRAILPAGADVSNFKPGEVKKLADGRLQVERVHAPATPPTDAERTDLARRQQAHSRQQATAADRELLAGGMQTGQERQLIEDQNSRENEFAGAAVRGANAATDTAEALRPAQVGMADAQTQAAQARAGYAGQMAEAEVAGAAAGVDRLKTMETENRELRRQLQRYQTGGTSRTGGASGTPAAGFQPKTADDILLMYETLKENGSADEADAFLRRHVGVPGANEQGAGSPAPAQSSPMLPAQPGAMAPLGPPTPTHLTPAVPATPAAQAPTASAPQASGQPMLPATPGGLVGGFVNRQPNPPVNGNPPPTSTPAVAPTATGNPVTTNPATTPQTATNPKTGQKMKLVGSTWVPA